MNTLLQPPKKASMKPFLLLLTTAAVLAATPVTHAAVTVSNLGTTDDSANYWGISRTQYIGTSFTVGSDYASWNLDSVDIRAKATGSPTTDFVVELHADDGSGKPAIAALGTFTGANPNAFGDYNFVPASTITLAAGLTYWLTAGSTVGSYGWIRSNPRSGAETTALTGWSIGDSIDYSIDKGASWDVFDAAPGKLAVNATGAVPEPGSLGLLALGGLAAATRRRRRVIG